MLTRYALFVAWVSIGWFATVSCTAQPATQPAEEGVDQETGFSLTVYSTADPGTFDPQRFAQQQRLNPYQQLRLPGYGVVREVRPIELQAGENTVRFTEVAAGIDPTTVSFQSLTEPQTTSVLEQNFEYDLVSPDKLLQKYVDQKILVVRKKGDNASEEVSGTLLSFDSGTLVVQIDAGVQLIPRGQDITSIQLAEVKGGLITKPTLVWTIDAEQAGRHDAQVGYQTDGLTWRADYNITVKNNDTAADVGAWVSILNQSGLSYPDTRLKLVAGDVQRLAPPEEAYLDRSEMRLGELSRRADTGFKEKAFFEYHLYTLGRETSLPNNSTKQIELFPSRSDVPIKKTFVYYGLPVELRLWISHEPNQDRNLGTRSNKKVDVYIELKNTEANGLGIPLPAGRIRVYKKDDADGSLEFIGEDLIQHTPKDEDVLVKLGSAFDIVGERKQTDFNVNVNGHVIIESFEIKLRNHKKEAAEVIIKENLFRWVNWEITQASDKWEKQDYRTIHIPVQVPVDGEKIVTYTVKYTW